MAVDPLDAGPPVSVLDAVTKLQKDIADLNDAPEGFQSYDREMRDRLSHLEQVIEGYLDISIHGALGFQELQRYWEIRDEGIPEELETPKRPSQTDSLETQPAQKRSKFSVLWLLWELRSAKQ